MSKFKALAADVVHAARMTIIDPFTQRLLADKAGKQAYIDFLSVDSDAGRAIDRARNFATVRKMRSGRNQAEDEDFIAEQVEKLVALAQGWYLVDPEGNPLEVPFSAADAKELFGDPAMGWLRRQGWAFVNAEANFIKRSATTSSSTPSTSSGSTESGTTAPASAST